MRASNIRLPGVYFLPPPRAGGPALPPLDVAAFVGFAERGPLDTPVAVEDLDAYRAIFGGDMPLARTPGGRSVNACLPSSVATFFANGGRRCYVVRVAGRRAKPTRFRLSGLVALKGDQDPAAVSTEDGPKLVRVEASSAGRWSERLRLGATLRATPLPVEAFEVLAPEASVDESGVSFIQRLRWTTGSAPQAIQKGDLLRLSFNGNRQFLFPIEEVRRPANATPATPVELRARQAWQLLLPKSEAPAHMIVRVDRLTPAGTERLNVTGVIKATGGTFSFRMKGDDAPLVALGDVLQIKRIDNQSFLFNVSELGTAKSASNVFQPQAHAGVLMRLPAQKLPPTPPSTLVAIERLRFDLLLREGAERRPTIAELSFNAGHTRFWADSLLLESSSLRRQASATDASTQDAKLSSSARSTQLSSSALSARIFREMQEDGRVDEARLALFDGAAMAGLLAPPGESNRTYLPLDMPSIFTEESINGPLAGEVGTDDLDTFDPGIFVDRFLVPELDGAAPYMRQTSSADRLLKEAFDRFYVQDKRLRGMHSLLFINEAAIVAVPDAAQREWERLTESPVPPPVVTPPAPPDLSNFDACHESLQPSPASASGSGADSGAPAQAATAPKLPSLKPLNPDDADDSQYKREMGNLVAIQHAALNLCVARRDAVAVFTLPNYFEKRQCIEWQESLREDLGLPRRRAAFDDARDIADLSYAAVYHPWLLIADSDSQDGTRAVPADGAACGMIAAHERERQAWVAPANVPLAGVLGLTPDFNNADWADLFDLQFNLTRPEPRDFRVMSAHTMSDESIWLQVSVRRLMILIRKLVVERGMDFVFESNHERFREGVRLMLAEVLRFMFERGAFAGRTPEESYQVVTDASVNTPQSVDAGRFVAQIQVAPSQPLEFITVLLTRVAEDLLLAREA